MGAHVWKRENGSASSQPSERQSVPEGSASAVVSDNSTETADVRNPPHKKQRVEPSPATADRINGSLASNGGVSVAATASAAAGKLIQCATAAGCQLQALRLVCVPRVLLHHCSVLEPIQGLSHLLGGLDPFVPPELP